MNKNLRDLAKRTSNPELKVDVPDSALEMLVYENEEGTVYLHAERGDILLFSNSIFMENELCYCNGHLFCVSLDTDVADHCNLKAPLDHRPVFKTPAKKMCSNGTDLFLIDGGKISKYNISNHETTQLVKTTNVIFSALAAGQKLWYAAYGCTDPDTMQIMEYNLEDQSLNEVRSTRSGVYAMCIHDGVLHYGLGYSVAGFGRGELNSYDSSALGLVDLNGRLLVQLSNQEGVRDVNTNEVILPPEKKVKTICTAPRQYFVDKGIIR